MLCTQSDLEIRVSPEKVRLWAIQKNSTVPDGEVVQDGIDWATEKVYTPLRKLYAAYIPFQEGQQPAELRNIAVTYAVYWLATRHSECSEVYVQDYRDARKELMSIARGEIPLTGADGSDLLDADPQIPADSHYAMSTTAGQQPVFSRQSLESLMRRWR